MTNLPETPTTPAGWYPDYTGQPQLRWWDGSRWTEHVHASAPQAYAPAQQQAQPYSAAPAKVAEGTPVYNPFIWILVLLPVISIVRSLTYRPTVIIPTASDPYAAVESPGYWLSILAGVLIYAVSVLLAFFDHRKLVKDGYDRPFPWPWAFLGAIVYIVGRVVVVRRRSGGGLAPLWVYIGLTVVSIIVGVTLLVQAAQPYLNHMNGIVPNA